MEDTLLEEKLNEPMDDEDKPEVDEPTPEAEEENEPEEVSEGNRKIKFLISNEEPDRDNDIVMQDGWVLDEFKNNPVFLVSHDKNKFPVGKFVDLSIKDKALYGTVEFAKKGTYDVADLAFELYSQGILKGCSVGFRPMNPIEQNVMANDKGGLTYMKQELLEVSAVSIPANPKALAISKSYKKEISNLLITKDEEIKPQAKDVEREATKVKLEETKKAEAKSSEILLEALKVLNKSLKR